MPASRVPGTIPVLPRQDPGFSPSRAIAQGSKIKKSPPHQVAIDLTDGDAEQVQPLLHHSRGDVALAHLAVDKRATDHNGPLY